MTTRHGLYPHSDEGAEVRRIFHKLHALVNEEFSGQFKAIFDGYKGVPTKGLAIQR